MIESKGLFQESSNKLSIEERSSSRVESGVSIASDRSSSLTSQSDDAVPDYNTGMSYLNYTFELIF